MTTHAKITEFLSDAKRTDNLATTREMYARALELLREIQGTHQKCIDLCETLIDAENESDSLASGMLLGCAFTMAQEISGRNLPEDKL